MFSRFVFLVVLLAGCNTPPRDPLPYSPNYQYLGGQSGVIRKGYDNGTAQLVPDACVTPDVAADPMYLPSGCANALNLQMTVAQQGDLIRGRATGPAMAAPSARAARRVIDGTATAIPLPTGETLTTTRQPLQ